MAINPLKYAGATEELNFKFYLTDIKLMQAKILLSSKWMSYPAMKRHEGTLHTM